MAIKNTPSTVDSTVDADGWVTVSEGAETLPTKVVFDSWGDVFVGRYRGPKTVNPGSGDPFQVYIFTHDGSDEQYSVGATNAMRSGMKKVRAGSEVRLTYVDDIESGTSGNYIKNIRIDVRQ